MYSLLREYFTFVAYILGVKFVFDGPDWTRGRGSCDVITLVMTITVIFFFLFTSLKNRWCLRTDLKDFVQTKYTSTRCKSNFPRDVSHDVGETSVGVE